MSSLIDAGNLVFWLFASLALGIVILVVLSIRHRSERRIDRQASVPTAALVDAGPDDLERFNRYAIEQLSAISQVLATKHLEMPSNRQEDGDSRRHVGYGAIGEQSDARLHMELSELDEKVRQLNGLAARLLDTEQLFVDMDRGALPTADTIAANNHYLFFTLGGAPFAVSASSVETIVGAARIVAGSGLSTRLRRAIRVRDALVPVIDLGSHFGGPPIEIGSGTSIIIFEVMRDDGMQLIGVLVDAVVNVLPISALDIQSPATSNGGIASDFICGTVTIDNQGVTLLDIGQGLSANEFLALGPRRPENE